MNKKTIYTIFSAGAAIIFLAILIFIAGPKNGNANKIADKISAISTQEKLFDFGSISMAAGKVSHIFKIKNSISQSMNIKKISTSCMCTSATLIINGEKTGPFGMPMHGITPEVNKSLAAGEEAEIEVIFDPAAHGPSGIGEIKRSVFVEDSFGGNLELQFYANVKP
ncbi:DUF1573 domain-containing protein [Candidatus Wolfebacteria bacterium]|nr:DUF1573 domain-containing protein [Candidatus Wolfebacteria bacterium]